MSRRRAIHIPMLLIAVVFVFVYSLLSEPRQAASQAGTGSCWISHAAVANAWINITHANGLFVAVSGFGTDRVMTSPDGISWTARTAAAANNWMSVAYGNGLFVAVAQSGTNRVMTSPDGITWTARSVPIQSWSGITYANGLFVAVAQNGTSAVMTSPDGITWTTRTIPLSANWYAITYGNGLYVAVALGGEVMTSPNGITWTIRTGPSGGGWTSITYGNGLFVAVTGSGPNRIMTSPDGITWTVRTAPEANMWYSVTYGNGRFVAVASAGTNRVMTSPDGVAWTMYLNTTDRWFAVTYGGGKFVAVGNSANQAMTDDCTASTAPQNLDATGGVGSNTLTWTAPSSNGGSSIVNYKIYRGTNSGPTTLLATIGAVTTYTDTTAVVGTIYYYRIKATNAIGDSGYSNEDSAVALTACPTTPSSANTHGWAWSDTIGWISLNSSDAGTCTTHAYGLDIASDGTISGYMWSENAGWISANASDLTGCPTSPCTARMEGNAMKGWFKALGANQAGSAWDGWISLSGSTYGPTIENGTIEGYIWGDTTLGWISFDTAFSSATTTWVQCSPSYQCTTETTYDDLCTIPVENTACTSGLICGGGAIACVIPPAPTPDGTAGTFKASPQLVAPGRTTTLTWDIRYATSCTVTEDNPNITDTWSTIEGNVTTSQIRQQTTYTLTCTGAGGDLTQRATVYQTPTWKEI
jgi:hypothetical protein